MSLSPSRKSSSVEFVSHVTGIPREFWRDVPCGHPPDPVAAHVEQGWACHCGWLLDAALAHVVEGAPAPIASCEKCGCHVAIPNLRDLRAGEPTSVLAFVAAGDLRYMTVGAGVLSLPGCRTVRMPAIPGELAEVEFEATAGTLSPDLIARELDRMGATPYALKVNDQRVYSCRACGWRRACGEDGEDCHS